MRKRMLLIVAPLCVVALAAGVAVAAPSGTGDSSEARLDKPHAVRPTAASPSVLEANSVAAALNHAIVFVQDVQAREIDAFVQDVQAREIGEFLDGVIATESAQARPTVRQSASAPSSEGDGGFLACVRQRESRGDYTIHNTQGSGASGAYQFMPGTWNSLAGSIGRTDLVGVDPAAASPADQDAMAAALYAQQGARPWGGGC
jgi:hypothetical protein